MQFNFIEKEHEAVCDLMHISQLVGGRARRVTLVLTTPDPAAPTPNGCTADAYLTAVPAEPASSPTPLGALAGPFPPRPASPAGAPGAGSGGWLEVRDRLRRKLVLRKPSAPLSSSLPSLTGLPRGRGHLPHDQQLWGQT